MREPIDPAANAVKRLSAEVSVCVSAHQPSSDRTLAVWLDSAPDLSCNDSTQGNCVDAEHQATDLVLMEFVEPGGVAVGYRLSRSRSLLVSRSSM